MGRARAWLRLALMQKKLADYLKVLIDHKDEVLAEYFEPDALMLSDEAIVIIGILVGLNVIDCNLCVKVYWMLKSGLEAFLHTAQFFRKRIWIVRREWSISRCIYGRPRTSRPIQTMRSRATIWRPFWTRRITLRNWIGTWSKWFLIKKSVLFMFFCTVVRPSRIYNPKSSHWPRQMRWWRRIWRLRRIIC